MEVRVHASSTFCTGEAVIVAGVVVVFLIILALLIAGVVFGVAIWRKEQERKRREPQRMGISQERSEANGTTQKDTPTEEEDEEEDTKYHVYDFVYVESSNERRDALYQGTETECPDYANVYNPSGRRELPGIGPEGQRGGAPLLESQQEGWTWKK